MRRSWLLDQLPGVMADDEFLVRFVGIFQEIADSVRGRVDGFDRLLDTAVAPPDLVRYMGRWIGFTVDSAIPDDQMRRLVKAAGLLFPWRGTQLGLAGLIETVTGHVASVEDSGGVFAEGAAPPNDHHIVVRVGGTGALTREQLTGLIEDELPVDVTYELIIGEDGGVPAMPEPEPAPRPPGGVRSRDEAARLSARVDRLLAAAMGEEGPVTEPVQPDDEDDEPGDATSAAAPLPERAPTGEETTDDPGGKPRFSSWWDGWGDDVIRRDDPAEREDGNG